MILDDEYEEIKNVFSLNSVKKEKIQEKEEVTIWYKNSEFIDTYICDYFGQSVELPSFLIIGQEDKTKEIIMIAVDNIAKISSKPIIIEA